MKKDTLKFILIVLIIIVCIALGIYFLKPIVSLLKGIHVPLANIVNKYYMDKESTIVFIFDENNVGSYLDVNDVSKTFTFTYEEGYLKSDEFSFFVIDENKLWFIEGRLYLYEVNN